MQKSRPSSSVIDHDADLDGRGIKRPRLSTLRIGGMPLGVVEGLAEWIDEAERLCGERPMLPELVAGARASLDRHLPQRGIHGTMRGARRGALARRTWVWPRMDSTVRVRGTWKRRPRRRAASSRAWRSPTLWERAATYNRHDNEQRRPRMRGKVCGARGAGETIRQGGREGHPERPALPMRYMASGACIDGQRRRRLWCGLKGYRRSAGPQAHAAELAGEGVESDAACARPAV